MSKVDQVLFEEFIDHCLRQRQLADLERSRRAGPAQEELTQWNLTPDEWAMALDRAIEEYKQCGPRGRPA